MSPRQVNALCFASRKLWCRADLRLWSVRMTWLIVLLVIWAAIATFMLRYQRHLDALTGPWITD